MDCIIYKIEDNTSDKLYIGSTTQDLKIRLNAHKCKKNCSSYEIIENGDYIISEIERCDSENRRYREQFWIDNSENCVNKNRAFRTPEQKKHKEYHKIYNQKRKYKRKEYDKIKYEYQSSWGGNMKNNNNLLSISLDIFM